MLSQLKENIVHGTKEYPYEQYYLRNINHAFQVPVHWHEQVEIIYVEEGNLRIKIGDSEWQCQIRYEKTELKNQAQMNLENCRYQRLWQTSATLDSTKKNCCRLITDGEELKNSSVFPSYTAVQQFFFVPSRASRDAVARLLPLALNLRTVIAFGILKIQDSLLAQKD